MAKSLNIKTRLLRLLDASEGKFFPNAFMRVKKRDLGEKFHAHDAQGPLQFMCDEKGNDQRVHAAGDAPRDGFDETTIMFVGHAAKR